MRSLNLAELSQFENRLLRSRMEVVRLSILPAAEMRREPEFEFDALRVFPRSLGVSTVLALLLHKIVSMFALSLVGLTLRNLFKINAERQLEL